MAEKYLNYDGLDELVTQIKAKLLGKVNVTDGVTNVGYDSTSKKLKQTINNSTSDIVTFGDNAFTSTTIPTAASQLSDYSDLAQASDVSAIEAKIPSAASSSNQLADKEFVNSSVSTATATFRGTKNLVSDLSLTTSATHSQVATALASVITTADANDYCFVQIPTADATPTQIASIDRYKYASNGWDYEYTLNNSGFTASQWQAINSGITSALVSQIGTNQSNITSLNSNKVDKTTTINGKALSSDITLTPSDIGAEPTISLTTGRALVSNSSGKVAVSDVTSTELGYLDGVTSNVQTQLNSKQPTLTAGDNITILNNVISAEGGVEEITQATNIWELDDGVYTGDITNFNYKPSTPIFAESKDAIVFVYKSNTNSKYYVAFYDDYMANGLGTNTATAPKSRMISSLLTTLDVKNNLTSTSITAPLSANMGKTLKDEIDTLPDTAITTAEIDALFS